VARIIAFAQAADAAERLRRQQESVARIRDLRSRLLRRLSVAEIVGPV
jgi:hypothetical protein